jgi:hypothetical protein
MHREAFHGLFAHFPLLRRLFEQLIEQRIHVPVQFKGEHHAETGQDL